MSAQGVHKITEDFEKALCDYTGAPYCVCVDNMSNALWLCLIWYEVKNTPIFIPSRTYPSVPCEIILAGGNVVWEQVEGTTLKGHYQLKPYPIWDSALRFTANMFMEGQMQCISFTGAYKHLKLSKGGAILLDDVNAYNWLKRMRNSGRNECSYHVDHFDIIGRNCYLMPEISARGLLLIQQFYNLDGTKKDMPDSELPYPDLSKFPVFQSPKFK